MERWMAKFIGLILTFLLPFIFTIMPHHMTGWIERQGDRGKRILCLLMCFGGGIFLATYLLHMGPEVRLIMEEALLTPNNITYPLPDFIIGCGFFGVLIFEKLIMRFNKRRTQKQRERRRDRCAMYEMNVSNESLRHSGGTPTHCDGIAQISNSIDTNKRATNSNDNNGYCTDKQNHVTRTVSDDGADKDRDASSTINVPAHSVDNVTSEATFYKTYRSRSMENIASSGDDEIGSYHAMRSIILILALSLHHLFEGISLGLQRSVAGAFTLLIALLCHETIISFSLGLQFVKCSYTMRQHYITAFACSIIEPIGVAVGMVMSEVGEPTTEMAIVDGILQAFATGTFIFVTFFEILQEEINPSDTSVSKVLSALAGFIVMSLLIMIPVEADEDTDHVLYNYTTVSLRT